MSHDIFVSYSRRDLAAVKPVKEELERLGFSCWMDLEGIESGSEEFTERIAEAIAGSTVVLFFLSTASQSSRWSLNELRLARSKGKPVVFVRFNDDPMDDKFILEFGGADIIDWRKPEQAAKLLRDLGHWTVRPSVASPSGTSGSVPASVAPPASPPASSSASSSASPPGAGPFRSLRALFAAVSVFAAILLSFLAFHVRESRPELPESGADPDSDGLDAGLIAAFSFDDGPADSIRPDRSFSFVRGHRKNPDDPVPVANGVLRLNGVYSGEDGNVVSADLPELRFDRFSGTVSFRPDELEGRPRPVLFFGRYSRWFGIEIQTNGTVAVLFSGLANTTRPFPPTLVESHRTDDPCRIGRWNRFAFSVDIPGRRLTCVLNGRRLPEFSLSPDFGYAFELKDSDKAVLFANTGNGTVFKGDVDDVRFFNRALSSAELDRIGTDPLRPWTFRFRDDRSFFWNGTMSDGEWTVGARLDGGRISIAPGSAKGYGLLDLAKPVLDERGKTFPVVGIGNGNLRVVPAFSERGSAVDAILLPETLEWLGPGALCQCSGIESIDLPEFLGGIGSHAFSGCRKIRTVRLGPAVSNIVETAFSGCDKMESIEVDSANVRFRSENGVLLAKDGRRIVCFPGGWRGPYRIPDGVETVNARTFSGSGGLTELYVPASVKTIWDYAFADCPGLTNIVFADRSLSLPDKAFGDVRSGDGADVRPKTNLISEKDLQN